MARSSAKFKSLWLDIDSFSKNAIDDNEYSPSAILRAVSANNFDEKHTRVEAIGATGPALFCSDEKVLPMSFNYKSPPSLAPKLVNPISLPVHYISSPTISRSPSPSIYYSDVSSDDEDSKDNSPEQKNDCEEKSDAFTRCVERYNLDLPMTKQLHMRTRAMQALDLEVDFSYNPVKKYADLEYEYAMRLATTMFLSTKDYIENMMYGPAGYYTLGKVDFQKDYTTYASDIETAHVFAAGFVHQLFAAWEGMLESGVLAKGAAFNVLECGAGNGNLCFNIFDISKKMASVNAKWREFYWALRYHIVERSPALVKRQANRVEVFQEDAKDNCKINIINADARRLKTALGPIKMAAVISNELLDMFPPHELILNEKGMIEVGMVAPYITHAAFLNHFDWHSEKTFDELLSKSEVNYQLIKKLCPNALLPQDVLLLTKEDYLYLHQLITNHERLLPLFKFFQYALPSEYFPEVKNYLKKHPQFTEQMEVDDRQYPVMGLDEFAANIDEVLMDHGSVIMVDYGGDDYELASEVRTYSENSPNFIFCKLLDMKRHDVFRAPGNEDLTVDVRFGDWVRAGEHRGFRLEFFGDQIQMLPKQVDFPDSVVSATAIKKYTEDDSGFKVCVQRKMLNPNCKLRQHPNRFAGLSRAVCGYALFKQFADKVSNGSRATTNDEHAQSAAPGALVSK